MNNTIKQLREEIKNVRKELEELNNCKEALISNYKRIEQIENSIKARAIMLDDFLMKLDAVDFSKEVNLDDLKPITDKSALDSYLNYLNTNRDFRDENSDIVFEHYIKDLMDNDAFIKKMSEDKK